jgi:hypothetical protein
LNEFASDKTNESVLKELEETNEAELKKFEERQAEPEKLEDERDVVDAIQDKANCLIKIGDKVGLRLTLRDVHCTYASYEGALEALKVALEKTVRQGRTLTLSSPSSGLASCLVTTT